MTKVIHWFRQDLRLSDNPALYQAAINMDVLPIYILDDVNAKDNKIGGASRSWLHHSLTSLNQSLGGKLSIYCGDPSQILSDICSRHNISKVFWNRCYEPWRMARDTHIKEHLKLLGTDVESHIGSLLWEPWTISKDDGTPYKVFTPFYRKGCLSAPSPRNPLPEPDYVNFIRDDTGTLSISDLKLLPAIAWDKKMLGYWEIGEAAAKDHLIRFLESAIIDYKEGPFSSEVHH